MTENSSLSSFYARTHTPHDHCVALDRMRDGLFLYFADGSSGFYPDALLYELLGRAVSMDALIQSGSTLVDSEPMHV
jgi:hypothetical protein